MTPDPIDIEFSSANSPRILSSGDGHTGDTPVFDTYTRKDDYNHLITTSIASNVHSILNKLGEDPQREGLLKTPERVAKAYQFLTHGYQMDPGEILRGALFEEDYSEMILVKTLSFTLFANIICCLFLAKRTLLTYPTAKLLALAKFQES